MIKALLITRFRSYFASIFKGGRKKRGPGFKVLAIILAVYVIGTFLTVLGTMFNSLCEPLYTAGLSWLYFAIAGLLGVALSFISGVFTAQSQIYDAKDNDLLLSMPIPTAYILASRMGVLLAIEYFFEILIALPAGVVYAMQCPVTAAGVVAFIICFAFLPLLSVTLSCVIGWLTALLSSRFSNKTLVSTVFSLVFLAVYFVIYFNAQKYLESLIANGEQIAEAVKKAMYPLYCLGDAIVTRDALSIIMFLLFCLVPFTLIYVILSRSFIKIATEKKSRKKVRRVSGEMKSSGVKKALLKKELRRFVSSPAYLMNSGFGVLIAVAAAVALIIKHEAFLEILEALPEVSNYLSLAACGAICVIFSMVLISAPSISLEGKCLWIPKSLPVDGGVILMSKANAHIVVSLPGVIILSASCAVFIGGSPLMLALMFVVPGLFVVLTALVGVAVNLKMPNFDWINEMVAVKQSMSVLLSMLFSFGIIISAVLIYFLLLASLLSAEMYLLIIAAVFAASSLWLRRRLITKGKERFEKL